MAVFNSYVTNYQRVMFSHSDEIDPVALVALTSWDTKGCNRFGAGISGQMWFVWMILMKYK